MKMMMKLLAGGLFAAGSLSAMGQATPAPAAPVPAAAAPAATPAMVSPNGTWKVTGNVQGVEVAMSCVLTVGADKAITGTCTDNTGSSSTAHPVTGTAKDMTLTWSFNSDYQGTAIVVGLTGTIDATGAKIAGTISVDPMNVDGDFTAVLQVAA